jgi:hypothetical protein
MAIEVDHGQYLFGRRPKSPPDNAPGPAIAVAKPTAQALLKAALAGDILGAPTSAADMKPATHATVPRPPFRHNTAHEFESLLWIATYFVVNMETARLDGSPNAWTPLTEQQLRYATSLFYTRDARTTAIMVNDGNPLDSHMRSLPRHLSGICELLIDLRLKLVSHYETIEQPGFVITETTSQALSEHFRETFLQIVRILKNKDIAMAPLGQNPLQA